MIQIAPFFLLSIGTQISDERCMAMDSRDDRVGDVELAALAGLKEGATPEQLQDTVDRLRQILERTDQRQLEPEDWTLLAALIRAEMGGDEVSSSRGAKARRSGQPRRKGGARSERLESTLDELRELLYRIDDQQLESADWRFTRALVWNEVARAEGRQARAIAKIVAAAAVAGAHEWVRWRRIQRRWRVDGELVSVRRRHNRDEQLVFVRGKLNEQRDANGKVDQGKSKASKGHGRNGASAYRQAQPFFHAVGRDVVGALREACRGAKLSSYREKVVIRIIGQPLFSAEGHHYEQARCRNCGHIVRAQGPADIGQGLGTDYVRYDWSACGMLIVMQYFGEAPFKRVESLHGGWGVPMSDANQWQVVSAGRRSAAAPVQGSRAARDSEGHELPSRRHRRNG